jgi:sulfate permease, SulP family
MSEVDATNAGRAQEAYRADSSPFVPAPERPLVQRMVPVVRDLRRLSGGNVRRDALAGVTVAALAVPSAMAYAELAGLSPVNGLYASLLPTVAYAVQACISEETRHGNA